MFNIFLILNTNKRVPWKTVKTHVKCHIITCIYTTLTNFSTKYLVMCKIYTDIGGIDS